jgi:hypothetical protein
MGTRRDFNAGLASLAFGGLALAGCGRLSKVGDYAKRLPDYSSGRVVDRAYYGPLEEKAGSLIDLPPGFSYEVISCHEPRSAELHEAARSCVARGGHRLEGGARVPDNFDGMASFCVPGRDDLVALVRNHELDGKDRLKGAYPDGVPDDVVAYRPKAGVPVAPGGTTNLLYDMGTGEVVQSLSLIGTRRNCAGGAAPWGSWLTCEENSSAGHGYVFDVPALARGPVEAVPLTHLGRFEHEAVAIDPKTGIAYLTEDEIDSLLYRYVPPPGGDARQPGGRLEALSLGAGKRNDTRNWRRDDWPDGAVREVGWVDLTDLVSRGEEILLRKEGARREAAIFANGEGIHFDALTGELYFVATSGGRIKSGQVMRLECAREGRPDRLHLFSEATDTRRINYADNLVVAPNGHLVVCEDPYLGGEGNYLLRGLDTKLGFDSAPCYLRGITPQGELYDLARLRTGSEFAGACFSPKGDILFVNIYSPGMTLAIRGPWDPPRPGWSLCPASEGAGGL